MRISDWSSDVCSSDLILIRRTSPSTRIIGGRPADKCRSDALFFTENASSSAISTYDLPCLYHGAPQSSQYSRNQRRSNPPHAQPGSSLAVVATAYRIRQARCRSSRPCWLAGRLQDPERRRNPRPRQRSEEHTSELQSLMRISYAVFCL